MGTDHRKLRLFVFLTGLLEGGTGVVLFFFPGVYKALFGLDPSFDDYFIRQIGMFELLVGSFIAYGAFDRELRPFALYAIYFHVLCLPFEGWLALTLQPHDLFWLSFVLFVVFHVVMLSFLIPLYRRSGFPWLAPAKGEGGGA